MQLAFGEYLWLFLSPNTDCTLTALLFNKEKKNTENTSKTT